MSWWPSSWLPTLPTIDFALPSSIQRRFISFALRRSLGHFLKPGQLDIQQIDSQIGSGYVQVRDLELDNDAINSIFTGLPVELHDGSLGKATVRIPWPNPLTSTVGLALESLHLTFHLNPTISNVPLNTVDLAESVASVADTFMHEELTPREEAALRESLHPDLAASTRSFDDNLPGGLDPFIMDEGVAHTEMEPAGVSIFATLIERLLARFDFDASDTKVTLVHPQHASFTLVIPEIRYGTEGRGTIPTRAEGTFGEVRAVTISGVTLTTRCLEPCSSHQISPSGFASQRHSPSHPYSLPPSTSLRSQSPIMPSSPCSDSSDFDEETQMRMSQSIIALPPRPISPTSTVASSMYQSAVSTASTAPGRECSSPRLWPNSANRDAISSSLDYTGGQKSPTLPPDNGPRNHPQLGIRMDDIQDEVLISLASEPITIRLSTPALIKTSSAMQGFASAQPSRLAQHSPPKVADRDTGQNNVANEKIRLDASIGVIACSFRARHIRSIREAAQLWSSHSPVRAAARSSSSHDALGPTWSNKIEASLRIRGAVILLLPQLAGSTSDSLSKFYARPLVPPHLPPGFVRVHLDDLSTTISVASPISHGSSTQRMLGTNATQSTTTEIVFSVSEISAFSFVSSANPTAVSQTSPLYAVPILITDPHLPSQYPSQHVPPNTDVTDAGCSLPMFEVMDWTDPMHRSTTAKLSLWRCKPLPHPHPHSHLQSSRLHAQHLAGRSPPAASIYASARRTTSSHSPLASPSSVRASISGSPSSPSTSPSSSPRKSGETAHRSHVSAVVVKISLPQSSPSRTDPGEHDGLQVEVDFAPLHVFLDLGLILASGGRYGSSEALEFLEEVFASEPTALSPETSLFVDNLSYGDDREDAATPPGTPRARDMFALREQERERERERRRLERLVLDDLDLGFDYRDDDHGQRTRHTQSHIHSWRKTQARARKQNDLLIMLRFPMIRAEVRVPPPPSCAPRSGAIVLDIHDLRLFPGGNPQGSRPLSTQFAEDDPFTNDAHLAGHPNDTTENTLLSATWRRLMIACSLVGADKASSILSLSSISTDGGDRRGVQFSADSSSAVSPARPSISLTKSAVLAPSGHSTSLTTVAVAVDIPSVHVELSKPNLDAIQLWADDLTQVMEAATSGTSHWDSDTERADSNNPSLIGSRFFAKTRVGSQASLSESERETITGDKFRGVRSETAIKVTISNAVARLLLPREAEHMDVRPFDIAASDLDVLIEFKPEGKDETVLTLGILDIVVTDTTKAGSNSPFLALTTPHSLTATTRSALKLRLTSLIVPETTSKESKLRLTLSGLTYNFYPNLDWAADLGRFVKAPPGAFESVVPSERTSVSIKLVDTSVRLLAPAFPGALVPYVGELNFSTVIVGSLPETSFNLDVPALSLFLVDDLATVSEGSTHGSVQATSFAPGAAFWKRAGYSLLTEVADVDVKYIRREGQHPTTRVLISHGDLRLHLCADTSTALVSFIGDFSSIFSSPSEAVPIPLRKRQEPSVLSNNAQTSRSLMASLDEHAFRQMPEIGAAPDMINDDLPTNMDYLDESFGAAAGLRELTDDDLDDCDINAPESVPVVKADQEGLISHYGGETIRMFQPQGMHIVQNFFDSMTPDTADETFSSEKTTLAVRVNNCNATLFLYDGYDWARTRRIIDEERREMRRKLAKIRQLVASGQTPDPSVEETSTLLFNSVYIGLEHNVDELEPGALIAAIDEELNDELDTASQSSWQSLKQQTSTSAAKSGQQVRASHKGMTRSRGPSIEFRFMALNVEVDQYGPGSPFVSRTFVTIRDVEILDHIKTSTWRKFLTAMREDSRGNIRETDSNMVKVEIRSVHPVPEHPSVEARLRAKILPLRLHVDQDALDFLKKFFSFKDPDSMPNPSTEPSDEIYFQQAEVFPVGIKLDYKPRRVDYRALRDGRTIELMNFFHFDGAEMTLRRITLTGITGWPKLFDMLNDLWTPDVKATQLVDVISGVAPIRSVVNVGSGVADLVLLPIAQYKKDGRVVRGLQKGATAFVKSTAMEAIKLGARLATGTQVILEQAENVLGGEYQDTITAEAVQPSPLLGELGDELSDNDTVDLISRYADQPMDVKEGVHTAYKSLKRNFSSAAQTILAVPMEVYERSGNEGPVRAVVRAVPIAVLKPMIGASEAVSKTLLGLHNSLDPKIRLENEAKYKQR